MSNVTFNRPVTGMTLDNINEYSDVCEHVNDGMPIVHLFGETDSFGPVDRTYACEQCRDKWLKDIENELHQCFDCKELFPKKDGITWKWWDDTEDERIFVCDTCQERDAHKDRSRASDDDYNSTLPDDDDDNMIDFKAIALLMSLCSHSGPQDTTHIDVGSRITYLEK